MARASATEKVGRAAPAAAAEQCWILVGACRGRVWLCRRLRRVRGGAVSVRFDGAWVLEREERRGDVVGFLHTHPGMPAVPSLRDVRTMHAWCSAFGKPLLCIIDGEDGLRAWVFADELEDAWELPLLQRFPRGVLIGVEDDGG